MPHARTLILAALFASPAFAQLHETDVILRARDSRVETGGFTDPDTLVFPLHVYMTILGEDGLPDRATEPGFESLTGEFPGAAEVSLRITGALRRWNGDDFLAIPAERMTIRKGAALISTPLADPQPPESGPLLVLGVTDPSSGDFHEHPGYQLLAPASDGLYLLALQVAVSTPKVAPSDPCYILVRQNFDDPAELAEARDWIGAHLLTPACPPSPADWTHDGVINSTDVSEFINTWFTDLAQGTLTADFDANGVVNSTDVSTFINAWFEALATGC